MDNTQRQLDHHCAALRRKIKLLICGVAVVICLIFFMSLVLTKSPNNVNCHVTSALLTDSNLTVEITIRNPNSFYRVHHDHIDITANYKNQTLGSTLNYASFSQGRNRETRLTPSFDGLILGGGDDLRGSNNCGNNYYDIIVKLNMQEEYKKQIAPKKRFQRNLEYTCELKVPSGSGSSFNTTLCRYLQIP
ncbi:uncharacterized protein LOC133716668 [Rosa rugosa]|uniref:uncharacterized protein LOC133716668 n=1 Tax=Rosa rugosa TaxID=74645 RepID=UPI002B41034E|nr:uncharacterized protein LOC133716668 [Rosa rugosa]